MAILNLRRLKQKVVGGTTQPLKIGGILDDGSDAKITIGTSGNLTASNLTATLNGLLTTNGQIKFPATQNPSADANTLDDYEEGTWTPSDAFGVVALTQNSGAYYIKIGTLVFASFDFIVGANSSGNYARINLPFAGASGHSGSGVISYNTKAIGITMNNGEFWLQSAIYAWANLTGGRFVGTVMYRTIA